MEKHIQKPIPVSKNFLVTIRRKLFNLRDDYPSSSRYDLSLSNDEKIALNSTNSCQMMGKQKIGRLLNS